MVYAEKFGIEVNFLTGRYVATSHSDRKKSEWPPHPARLYSALVATWVDADEVDPEERDVLKWLESQDPPLVAASEAVARKVVGYFVPVNDTAVISRGWQNSRADNIRTLNRQLDEELGASLGEITRKARKIQDKLDRERNVEKQVSQIGKTKPSTGMQLLPDHRGKQERFFPSVTPDVARVTYIWRTSIPEGRGNVLDTLLGRVTRLGHSSSLVTCRLVKNPPDPDFVPGESGEQLRTVRRGQLAELQKLHGRHEGVRPRSLPYTDVHYRKVRRDDPAEARQEANTLGDWIVFELGHRSRALPATRAVEVATAMRSAIFHYAEDPILEELSGHRQGGAPTEDPHVAFLPIPYVGSEHADGRILGVALSVPRSLKEFSRRALHRAIGTWEARISRSPLKLTMGPGGALYLSRVLGLSTLISLRPRIWQRPSLRWVSATPIALPRHPGLLGRGTQASRKKAWAQAEAAVRLACSHVGLPAPAVVEVSLAPLLVGARPIRSFPAFVQRGRGGKPIRRQLVHAALTFEEPVSGPLMLGAGRFLGLGLMRPVGQRSVGVTPSAAG